MSDRKLEGVVTILVTPFDDHGIVDTNSLQQLVDFNLGEGVHGVGIAMGSEVFRLSENERDLATRVVVDQVRARVPVVVNTGAPGTDLAVLYSERAQELGADAVMVLPPGPLPASPGEVRAYFRAISDALEIPIVIQDAGPAQVAPDLIRQIVEESPRARYAKVESPPTAPRVEQTVRLTDGNVAVFGGAGGNFFIEELRRGSIGTMPGCSHPATFVRIWDLYQAGDEEGAKRTFYEDVLPINRVAVAGLGQFYHVHKEILLRRGIIETAYVRQPTTPLDEISRRELDAVIERMFSTTVAPG